MKGRKCGLKTSLSEQVDSLDEHGLEFLDKCQVVTKTTVLRHVDQQINVAVLPFFAAGDRAEQTEVGGTMTGCDGGQQITPSVELVS